MIYTVAPSPLDAKRIWSGTDDGLIHLTTDGGTNVDQRDAANCFCVAKDFAHRSRTF